MNTLYKISSDCIPVGGAQRSAIYDLTRNEIHLVPNNIFTILNNSKYLKSTDIFFESTLDEIKFFREYIIDNEILHEVDETNQENFIEIERKFHSNVHLFSAVLFFNHKRKNISQFFSIPENLGCKHFSIVFSEQISEKQISEMLIELNKVSFYSTANTIEVAVVNSNPSIQKIISEINEKNKRFYRLIVFNACKKETQKHGDIYITCTPRDLTIFDNKSNIFTENIEINMNTYLESLNHNLFYNKKVFIFDDEKIYADLGKNIFIDNLENLSEFSISQNKKLQSFWNISKDKIDICKDCEFRFACPDDRIPQKVNSNYFFKNKCNYNPYTMHWDIK